MNIEKELEARIEFYSFIYTELHKLTMVLKVWDNEKIQKRMCELLSDRYEKYPPTEFEYDSDGEHGYNGKWKVHVGEKKLFKKRTCFKFDLFDRRLWEHKEQMEISNRIHNRIHNINAILEE